MVVNSGIYFDLYNIFAVSHSAYTRPLARPLTYVKSAAKFPIKNWSEIT